MSAARGAALLALLATLLAAAAAQLGGGPPKVKPQLVDIPYIQCQVCELLTKNAWRQVKEFQKAATPTNKVDEMKIIELMEKITTAWRPEGEWITKLDLVEQGDRLVVKEMAEVGKCGVECKTVEAAAERIMGEHDTDIAEMLFTGKKNRAQFNNWLCYETTGVCSRKAPPLPKDRQPGPPFEPMPEGDQNLERMLGEMQDKGMKGSLYSRDELMAKYGLPEGHEDEDEDEGRPDRAADFEGQPIDWHHIEGGKPPYTTRTPAQRVVNQAAGAAKQAAAAAREGVLAAAEKAKKMWNDFHSGQQDKAEL